ncbi:putative ICC-like phosphoesterase [Archaeoglobus sulfaticallidus PM70-1]|uniref:Putative ICC-like phosphoesterase n=1 Tax=Archaeoglobus sulfaticallidus PM70-1 TaxID=387631 RepID=N0BE27_9EURY|nr:metallophosphoesterase [Archaeoglobus sulfaticallidus]AGK60472.1 putative ICC-like phosphoesterase [Archaeoglobus sulfaticallidus PM70-1]
MLRIVPDKPLIEIRGRERWIVLADLHLGLVHFDRKVIENAVRAAEGYDGVILLGDVKHDIGLRLRELKEVENLKDNLLNLGIDEGNIVLVKGNHDGGIDEVIKTEGFFISKDTGFFHGHRKPPEEVLESRNIVFAHIHPAVFIQDVVGGFKRRVWLSGKWGDRNVTVMPAFNDLCSSLAVNLEKKIIQQYKLSNFDVFLLDGTKLGRIENI